MIVIFITKNLNERTALCRYVNEVAKMGGKEIDRYVAHVS